MCTVSTPDFFRARLDGMVDLNHPLVVLTSTLAWDRVEAALAPTCARCVTKHPGHYSATYLYPMMGDLRTQVSLVS
jgi:hypothetical protein